MHKTLLTINEEIKCYIANVEQANAHDYSKITELAIRYISDRLQVVKDRFEQDKSITPNEEIFYFKNIKCHLLALIQYYTLVQKIELKKPPLRKKRLKQYYLDALQNKKETTETTVFLQLLQGKPQPV